MTNNSDSAGRTSDVVVVGNVGVDTNVYGLPFAPSQGRAPMPSPAAESSFCDNRDVVGQAGGYAARGYAALDLSTAFIGHVGDDPMGRWIREVLGADGVDLRGLAVDPAGTARSVNLMRDDGTRLGCYDGRGHMVLPPPHEDTCRAVLAGARLVHVNLANWARRVLPWAREAGATVACDLQDLHDLEDPYRADFIAAADIVAFSAVNQGGPGGLDTLLHRLWDRRPEVTVVVGLGSAGCAVGDPVSRRWERFGPVAHGDPVRDSNGAGDSLLVGFASARVLFGADLAQAAEWGQRCARHCCTLRGTSDGLMGREALPRLGQGGDQ